MSKRKIISLIVVLGVASCGTLFAFNRIVSAEGHKSMIIMNYKPSAEVNQNGYQIDKLENTEVAAWINGNEVVTLTKKDELKNPGSTIYIQYCSILNLNTKTVRDFKNVNIDYFIGVSPDGKYGLYQEPKHIPKMGSEEYNKAVQSGEILHDEIKVIDFTNGDTFPLKTEYKNKDCEYAWVSKDKIWANYFDHWAIINLSGKVIESGNYDKDLYDAWIGGFDVKDNGDTVEGKIYYRQDKVGENLRRAGMAFSSTDLKTKETKQIFFNKNSLEGFKKGKSILIDRYVDKGEKSPGVYNRTFGAYIVNENGKVLKEFDFEKYAGLMSLSPDGSKLAYVEGVYPEDNPTKLKIRDIRTGEVKEIMVTKLIKHVEWDKTGKSLSFTTGDSSWASPYNDIKNIDTYIVNFDN